MVGKRNLMIRISNLVVGNRYLVIGKGNLLVGKENLVVGKGNLVAGKGFWGIGMTPKAESTKRNECEELTPYPSLRKRGEKVVWHEDTKKMSTN